MSSREATIAAVGRAVSGAVVAAVVVLAAATGPVGAAGGQVDPLVAPHTTLSGDGRTASDGVRSLTVERVAGIDAGGAVVTVSGSGFDVNKGIYVAMCAIPAPNQLPTPCGGGVDQTGASGASAWITSNPPSYGRGLNTPYGAGGSFTVALNVAAVSGMLDCRAVPCAVVTRNDHTRNSDRSQDIFVPISFADAVQPPPADPPATWRPATPPPATGPALPADPGSPTWPSPPDDGAPVDDLESTTTVSEDPDTTTSEPTSTTGSTSTSTSEVGDPDGGAEPVEAASASVGPDGSDPSGGSADGSAVGAVAIASVVVAALGGGGYAFWRRRSSTTPAP